MTNINYKPVFPKKFNPSAFEAESRRAMKMVQDETNKLYARTVKTWEHKPKFESNYRETSAGITVEVFTTDEVYGYVNNGTRPHVIEGNPYLAFMSAYKSKTTPSKIDARKGGGSGPTIIRQKVQHPGTEARNFDTAIAAKIAPFQAHRLRIAMKKARVDSGHPYT